MKLLDLRSEIKKNEDAKSMGRDFYVLEMSKIDIEDHPFKIDMYICCICLNGESRGRINLKPYNIMASGISINLPGQLLEHEFISDDFKGLCIFMSKEFVGSLGLPYDFQINTLVQENPVLALGQEQLAAMLSYYTMVGNVIEDQHPNQSEIIKHLTCAFFYGIGYYFYQVSRNKVLSNEEVLMQNFLREVRQNYKKERKVLYYADRMHFSPGYLSTIIKSFSGKTAAEWIDDYVILEAKALLKSTNMTVQQVSDELNFPSQSFFGKYFKRQTGVSPKEYKKN